MKKTLDIEAALKSGQIKKSRKNRKDGPCKPL